MEPSYKDKFKWVIHGLSDPAPEVHWEHQPSGWRLGRQPPSCSPRNSIRLVKHSVLLACKCKNKNKKQNQQRGAGGDEKSWPLPFSAEVRRSFRGRNGNSFPFFTHRTRGMNLEAEQEGREAMRPIGVSTPVPRLWFLSSLIP